MTRLSSGIALIAAVALSASLLLSAAGVAAAAGGCGGVVATRKLLAARDAEIADSLKTLEGPDPVDPSTLTCPITAGGFVLPARCCIVQPHSDNNDCTDPCSYDNGGNSGSDYHALWINSGANPSGPCGATDCSGYVPTNDATKICRNGAGGVTIQGTMVSRGDSTLTAEVDLVYSNPVTTDPEDPGLKKACYKDITCELDMPNTIECLGTTAGTITLKSSNPVIEDCVYAVTRRGPPTQIGSYANDKSIADGLSGWISLTCDATKTNAAGGNCADCLPSNTPGDINIDISCPNCPPADPSEPTWGTPSYWGAPAECVALDGVVPVNFGDDYNNPCIRCGVEDDHSWLAHLGDYAAIGHLYEPPSSDGWCCCAWAKYEQCVEHLTGWCGVDGAGRALGADCCSFESPEDFCAHIFDLFYFICKLICNGCHNGYCTGDPHLRLSDNSRHDFQGPGEYVMVKNLEAAGGPFHMHAFLKPLMRYSPDRTPPLYSMGITGTAAVAFRKGPFTITASSKVSDTEEGVFSTNDFDQDCKYVFTDTSSGESVSQELTFAGADVPDGTFLKSNRWTELGRDGGVLIQVKHIRNEAENLGRGTVTMQAIKLDAGGNPAGLLEQLVTSCRMAGVTCVNNRVGTVINEDGTESAVMEKHCTTTLIDARLKKPGAARSISVLGAEESLDVDEIDAELEVDPETADADITGYETCRTAGILGPDTGCDPYVDLSGDTLYDAMACKAANMAGQLGGNAFKSCLDAEWCLKSRVEGTSEPTLLAGLFPSTTPAPLGYCSRHWVSREMHNAAGETWNLVEGSGSAKMCHPFAPPPPDSLRALDASGAPLREVTNAEESSEDPCAVLGSEITAIIVDSIQQGLDKGLEEAVAELGEVDQDALDMDFVNEIAYDTCVYFIYELEMEEEEAARTGGGAQRGAEASRTAVLTMISDMAYKMGADTAQDAAVAETSAKESEAPKKGRKGMKREGKKRAAATRGSPRTTASANSGRSSATSGS